MFRKYATLIHRMLLSVPCVFFALWLIQTLSRQIRLQLRKALKRYTVIPNSSEKINVIKNTAAFHCYLTFNRTAIFNGSHFWWIYLSAVFPSLFLQMNFQFSKEQVIFYLIFHAHSKQIYEIVGFGPFYIPIWSRYF